MNTQINHKFFKLIDSRGRFIGYLSDEVTVHDIAKLHLAGYDVELNHEIELEKKKCKLG